VLVAGKFDVPDTFATELKGPDRGERSDAAVREADAVRFLI